MPITVGNITLLMGPQQAGAPDDLQAAIIDFIDGAKKRLSIAVQELDNPLIARAIIRARMRKVRVRLVLEADYLKAKTPSKDPWSAGGGHEENRVIHDAILRSALWVRSDFNAKIFHQKFIVRDGSAVLTGSTNFTKTGVTKNLNHIVIIKSKKVANIFTKEFNEIAEGHFGKLNEGHDPAPPDVTVSGMRVRVAFAPDHAPEMEIMKHMLKAKKRIDFAIFTFSKTSGIDDAMIAASRAGKVITGALDGLQANQAWAATRPVKNAGATLYSVSSSALVGKLHHKMMVIDDHVLIIGSFNYTGPANKLNDENIVVIGDRDATSPEAKKGQRALVRYARKEIERIIEEHGRKIR